MKYCSHCGNELFEDAVVCPKCGCQVRDFNFNSNNSAKVNETAQQQPIKKQTNVMALVGFILSFLVPLLGLIFSCIGRNQLIQNPDQEGETYAKAGIIISAIRLGVDVLGSIFGVVIALITMGIILI